MVAAVLRWLYVDDRYPSWYQEVRLSDGRVITIHQRHEVFDNYGTNQSWVEIDLPELDGKRVWHSYLKPMRVDVHGGSVFVFGRPRGPRQMAYYRYPTNHMVAFKWTGSTFVRIPFLQLPGELRREENVYPCVPNPRPKTLTLSKKASEWCPATGDQGQFVRRIDLMEYKALADSMAAKSNWTDRSD